MRRTTVLLAALLLAAAAACSSGPSYDDTVKDCARALAAQSKAGGSGKPSACKDVKDDDYTALALSQAMDSEGWLDKDGNFDEGKMLDSLDK